MGEGASLWVKLQAQAEIHGGLLDGQPQDWVCAQARIHIDSLVQESDADSAFD
jgi:hypothetical protein